LAERPDLCEILVTMKRLFVAMHLAQSTVDKLMEAQAELTSLKAGAADRIRPVGRQAVHLTLKFLGETDEARLPVLEQALGKVAERAQKIDAWVSGVGAFPEPRRPRAIFGAITKGVDAIVSLAEDLELVCDDLGFPAENRPRVPHATLARVENARPNGPLSDWIGRHANTDFGPVLGEHIVLYESKLAPGGSVYTALATLALG
jgi:2'-5' RNA ligase